MSASRIKALQFLKSAFPRDDMVTLTRKPEFMEAVARIQTVDDALAVICLGNGYLPAVPNSPPSITGRIRLPPKKGQSGRVAQRVRKE